MRGGFQKQIEVARGQFLSSSRDPVRPGFSCASTGYAAKCAIVIVEFSKETFW